MMVFWLIFYGRAVALSGAVAAEAAAAMCRHTWRMGKGENWGPNNDELAVDNQSKGQVRYRQEESTISFNIPLLFTRERKGRETTARYEKKKMPPLLIFVLNSSSAVHIRRPIYDNIDKIKMNRFFVLVCVCVSIGWVVQAVKASTKASRLQDHRSENPHKSKSLGDIFRKWNLFSFFFFLL